MDLRPRAGETRPSGFLAGGRSVNALVVVSHPEKIEAIVATLRAHGLRPIVAVSAGQAIRLVARSKLDLAILVNGSEAPSVPLLRHLGRREIPVVLAAKADQIAHAEEAGTVMAAVPAPFEAVEIAAAAEIALGQGALRPMPEIIEFGPLRVHLSSRLALIAGEPVELPPIEFAILAELARQGREPISSAELIRRVWPENASITAGDVHKHIYRLREMIGDRQRIPPLLVNRRGYGYLLNRAWSDAVRVDLAGNDFRRFPATSWARAPGPSLLGKRRPRSPGMASRTPSDGRST